MTKLCNLRIVVASNLKDISAVRNFPQLNVINLDDFPVLASLRGLERCIERQRISLDKCHQSTSLKSFTDCSQLQTLPVKYLSLGNLNELQNKPDLNSVELYRSRNKFTDLRWLAGCTGLQILQIYSQNLRDRRPNQTSFLTKFKHIDALAANTKLIKHELPKTPIINLDCLKKCCLLEYLYVSNGKKLQDIAGINDCTGLTFFNITRCPSNVTDELQKLSNLAELVVSSRSRERIKKCVNLDLTLLPLVPPTD